MRATSEAIEGNRVRLSVAVDEDEIDGVLGEAIRAISRRARVPGFRPGKVPRQVLEARMGGAGALRSEALREAIPDFYARALADAEVDPISAPEIAVTEGEESGALSFDALVEVRPAVAIPGYAGLRVTVPSPTVEESEIDAQIDRLRETDAELVDVDRPGREGDHVTIDLRALREGQEISSVDDLLYEIGSGRVPGLDERLLGAGAGDAVVFSVPVHSDAPPAGDAPEAPGTSANDETPPEAEPADETPPEAEPADGAPPEPEPADGAPPEAEPADGAPGEPEPADGAPGEPSGQIEYRITVKDLKEKKLPEVTDEWAAESSEHRSVEELRAGLRSRLAQVKAFQAQLSLRGGATAALAGLLEDAEVPQSLVDEQLRDALNEFGQRLEEQRLSVASYLAMSGQSEDGLLTGLRRQALERVKVDLALRALAREEALEVSDEEIDTQIQAMATELGITPGVVRERLTHAGRMSAVRSEQKKAKALSWLLEHVEIVDEEGRPVARERLEGADSGTEGTADMDRGEDMHGAASVGDSEVAAEGQAHAEELSEANDQ